jgi:hypothetical protein
VKARLLKMPAVQRLQSEWSSSARLRIGTWVVLAILVLYACLSLVEWRRSLLNDYEQASNRLYKTAALAGEERWLQRAQDARDLRRALEAQIPSAGTLGLAQAESQTWVQQLLRAYGRDMSSQANAPVPVDAAAGLWKVPVTIRGALTPGQFVEMLRRIEGNDRLMVIERISIDNQRRPTIDMTITAFYRVRAAGQAAGGSANGG